MIRTSFLRTAVVCSLFAAWLAGVTIASQRSASSMAKAATRFMEALTPEQRQKAVMTMAADDRLHWNFIPTSMFPRNGLPIKEMTEPQRKLAHELLRSGLSQRGYVAATTIMDLENVLKVIEAGRSNSPVRDQELYFFTIFGTPGDKGAWGWRVEGHHISLHFTISNGSAVASSPTFLGSNPAVVLDGDKKGVRALGVLQDAGRAMVTALDDTQKTTAIINTVAPTEIVTNTKVQIDPLSPPGIAAAAMTPAQRDLLQKLIEAYTSEMAEDTASERLAEIRKAGIEKVHFAWAGETEPGKKHYYRVQGPTFLIEFDNTQNDGNHIHSVWRDFDSDFGRDLLREHVAAVPH
jgi:hypothetical protein